MPKRLTLALMQRMAAARGGACLSPVYKGMLVKLLWKCGRGHTWRALPQSVRQGHWCKQCADDERRLTIADLVELAARRKEKVLATVYVNTQTHVRWRCASGHVWRAIPNSISQGTWCPHCGR